MLRKAEFGPIINDYPTSDGRPMAETDHHRLLMTDLIETLTDHFADRPNVYVSGNLLLFYEEGNKRRHVSPDVMVVFGVPKYPRLNYRVWIEGKVPSVVIELTSSTTRREDQTKKLTLYRDVLKVPEYILFDPFGDYLEPRFQGYRLIDGDYRPIRLKDGRMKCKKLGLELIQDGNDLRLIEPATGVRLPTRQERVVAAEAEAARLQQELDVIRGRGRA
jgi:Uma2 family endonuclease